VLLHDRAKAEADATHGDTSWIAKEFLPSSARMQITAARYTSKGHCCCRWERRPVPLRDRARAEADATTGNTSGNCWTARELLEHRQQQLGARKRGIAV